MEEKVFERCDDDVGDKNLGFQKLACLRDGKVSLLLFHFFGRLH
jgi:hypothetical protein